MSSRRHLVYTVSSRPAKEPVFKKKKKKIFQSYLPVSDVGMVFTFFILKGNKERCDSSPGILQSKVGMVLAEKLKNTEDPVLDLYWHHSQTRG